MNSFNNFSDMPQIPYKILIHLIQNNENIFKLLKYNTSDALSKPNLTVAEKMALLYIDGEKENEYNIFLKPLIGDEIIKGCSQLRLYKATMQPTDHLTALLNYEFDIICGERIGLVYDENDIPCTRIDLIEKELLNELNGLDAFGVGYFQFNKELSRACSEQLRLSNSKTFYGSSLILAVNYSAIKGDVCG
jgi:hypothetical protein